jgi:diguanylate cyclase (GGDEF)-like protein/PAS domain S-box-containing protein
MPINLLRIYRALRSRRTLRGHVDRQITRMGSGNSESSATASARPGNSVADWLSRINIGLSAFNPENGGLAGRYRAMPRLCVALNRWKQAIPNCKTEDELYCPVCRTAVVHGGIKTAGIGLLKTIIDTSPIRMFWKNEQFPFSGCKPAFVRDVEHSTPEDIARQKRAEESVKTAIQRLNEAQRIAQIGSWELNLASGMLFWSDEIYRIFEIDKTEFGASYEDFLDSIHPDERDLVSQAYAKSLESHAPYEITHRLLMADGRIKWIHERGETVYDAQGKPLISKGTAQDVTARKSAEDLFKRHKMVIDAARDGFWTVDMDGNLLEVNQAYAAMSGYSIAELERMNIGDLEAKEGVSDTQSHIAAIIAQGSDLFESVHRRKDGTFFDVEVSVNYMADLGLLFAFFRDITSRKQTQTEILRLLSRQQAILDGANYSIIVTDKEGVITDFNAGAERMLGYRAEEMVGRRTPAILHDPEEVRLHAEQLSQELAHPVMAGFDVFVAKAKLGMVEEREWTYIRKDGSRFPVLLSVTAMRDHEQRIAGFMGIASDISERKKAQEDLHIAAATFETHEAIMITNAEGVIMRVNNAFENITGFSKQEVINRNPRILNSGRHDKAFFTAFWNTLKTKGAWSGEIWDRHKSGRIYPKYLRVSAVKSADGETTQYVAMFSDISERKKTEEEIYNLAFYDPLTGLPNRRLLYDRLGVAMATSGRSRQYGALLYLDLDNFKKLNDTRGHEVGDRLLIEVGNRLRAIVRKLDTVARIGGDEFLVLLENIGHEEQGATQNVAQIAEKIRAALSEEYQIDEFSLYSSPSIGVCLFRGHDISLKDLVKHADIAMYHAKDAGKNKVRFFDPQLQLLMEKRFTLESDLRRAIIEGQLALYYQIQVDSDLRPIGAEALIRWLHPERGEVSPSEFIAVAEESSLILDIGHWVLETACRQIAEWSRCEQTQGLVLAVNISAKQFMQLDFIEKLAALMNRHGVEPSRLKLELTESIVLDDVEVAILKMRALKQVLGVSLSLDDFGTGYSSLSYLKRLPIEQIKIDRTFVRDVNINESDAVMVKTIIELAHNFGLKVIAEGVETEKQLRRLREYGAIAYQGYFFGRPLPLAQFEKSLKAGSRLKAKH